MLWYVPVSHGQCAVQCCPTGRGRNTEIVFPSFLASHPDRTRVNFLELLQLKNGEMGECLVNAALQKWRFLWLMSSHSATRTMARCCSTAWLGNVSNTAVKPWWRGREHKCLDSQFVFGQACMEWECLSLSQMLLSTGFSLTVFTISVASIPCQAFQVLSPCIPGKNINSQHWWWNK